MRWKTDGLRDSLLEPKMRIIAEREVQHVKALVEIVKYYAIEMITGLALLNTLHLTLLLWVTKLTVT